MKRFSIVVGFLALGLIFSTSMGLAQDKTYTLQFTTVAAPTQPIVKGMEKFAEVVDKFDISAGNVSIIRLMGPDRQKIEKLTAGRWDRIVSAKDDSLESVARIVEDHIERTRQVIVNVNNHYEGCAVVTIDRLVDVLRGI